jgi:hypothetical protein
MISQRPNPKAKSTGKIALLGGRDYATKGPKNYRLEKFNALSRVRATLVSHLRRSGFFLAGFPTASAVG